MAYQNLDDAIVDAMIKETPAPKTFAQQCILHPITRQQNVAIFEWLSKNPDVRGFNFDSTGVVRVVFNTGALQKGLLALERRKINYTLDDVIIAEPGQIVILPGNAVRYAYTTKDNHYVLGVSKKNCAMM